MKRNSATWALAIFAAVQCGVVVSAQKSGDPMAGVGKSPAQLMGVYVFGKKSQDAATQKADEMACYESAREQSGYDEQMANADAPGQADAPKTKGIVRNTAGGAVKGAVIGAVAGDDNDGTRKGAKVGAAVGAMKSPAEKRKARAQQAQNQAQAEDQNRAKAMDDLRRAFGACMDARDYSVK